MNRSRGAPESPPASPKCNGIAEPEEHAILSHRLNRRRALQTLFCSSAALALNVRRSPADALEGPGLHLLAIGDFGTTGEFQVQVSRAMQGFVQKQSIDPEGMLLLGDNFYSAVKDGFTPQSERWRTGFEEMYPSAAFPGPCWAILGNHDYHDNAGGERVQLEYARLGQSRWTMPAKWYRLDLGSPTALLTILALDSNLPSVSGGKNKKTGEPRACLTPREAEDQLQWLQSQLEGPRAPLTLVIGHHPLYSNGSHGDTAPLIEQWGGLFEQHRVQAYLCGHDHDLQHLELDGLFTSFIISGGGGARTRTMPGEHPREFGRDVYGFTHVQVASDRMIFEHIDLNGELLHRFTKSADGAMRVG